MKNVYLVENNCCGSSLTEVSNFLTKRLGNEGKVESLNLARVTEVSVIPKVVRQRVEVAGLEVLPMIVVNDVIVSEGFIPNFLDVMELLESGKPMTKPNNQAIPKKACCGS